MRGMCERSAADSTGTVWVTVAGFVAVMLVAPVGATTQKTAASAPSSTDFMRHCSYALWYPWYVRNQSKRATDPEPPRPEPDGPREPIGEKCLGQLRQELTKAGRPQPVDAEVVELRAAAKAGKSAALFQAFEELKASRRDR
jgi:hypothetical protein